MTISLFLPYLNLLIFLTLTNFLPHFQRKFACKLSTPPCKFAGKLSTPLASLSVNLHHHLPANACVRVQGRKFACKASQVFAQTFNPASQVFAQTFNLPSQVCRQTFNLVSQVCMQTCSTASQVCTQTFNPTYRITLPVVPHKAVAEVSKIGNL